jgi:hypothetical protein
VLLFHSEGEPHDRGLPLTAPAEQLTAVILGHTTRVVVETPRSIPAYVLTDPTWSASTARSCGWRETRARTPSTSTRTRLGWRWRPSDAAKMSWFTVTPIRSSTRTCSKAGIAWRRSAVDSSTCAPSGCSRSGPDARSSTTSSLPSSTSTSLTRARVAPCVAARC